MANLCSICFCLSMYLSDGGQQTVEVGMINYTWPCLVVLFAILFNGQKARWWIVPGVIISFAGIMLVLGGEKGIDLPGIWRHMQGNPWSYLLAFCGAVAWAAYSNLTPRLVGRAESHAYCFCAGFSVFASLWIAGYGDLSHATFMGWISVAVWGRGHGRFLCRLELWSDQRGISPFWPVASYFTPVLSCLFATVWIGASLDASFWKGVAVVVLGSLMCWGSTYFRR